MIAITNAPTSRYAAENRRNHFAYFRDNVSTLARREPGSGAPVRKNRCARA